MSTTTERCRVGIVGAGRVGTTLGVVLSQAGWPVVAVASRDVTRRERFVALVPAALAVPTAQGVVDRADLVFVTVPDDAVAEVAESIRLRPGQGIVHTSGALSASVLSPAQVAGTTAASFHPLVPFADLVRAVEALVGATVAIEGDPDLVATLSDLATDIGAHPIAITAEGKAAHHAAAVLAGGGIVALLDAIAALARGAGLDEHAALETYVPLIQMGLANADVLGIGAALTGPFVRGDVRTVRLHLEAIDRLAPDARDLYVAAADRQIAIAAGRGDLTDEQAGLLRDLLRPASPRRPAADA